jgi:hypothetical protein
MFGPSGRHKRRAVSLHYRTVGFSLKSDLPPRLHKKLAFEFQQCIEIYVSFVWDPHRFLRNTPYACLFNNESGVYAVFYRLDTDRFIFISLSPGGNVAVALLDIPECEKEMSRPAAER